MRAWPPEPICVPKPRTSSRTNGDSIGSMILYGNGSVSKLLRSDSLYRNLANATSRADSIRARIASCAVAAL